MTSSSNRSFLSGPPQPLVVVRPQPNFDVFELYQRLSRSDHPSFLLESANGTSVTARYSFFGNDPYLTLSGRAPDYQIRVPGGSRPTTARPLTRFNKRWQTRQLHSQMGCRHFLGAPSGTLDTISSARSNHSPRWPSMIFAFRICT